MDIKTEKVYEHLNIISQHSPSSIKLPWTISSNSFPSVLLPRDSNDNKIIAERYKSIVTKVR